MKYQEKGKKQRRRKELKIWNDNIAKGINEKSAMYKKSLQTKLPTDKSEYKKEVQSQKER